MNKTVSVPETFICARCNQVKPVSHDGGTGYAEDPETDAKTCYSCCAEVDRESLRRGEPQVLYLTRSNGDDFWGTGWVVTNWPGTLRIGVRSITRGSHNIARTRKDVWFNAEDREWHGVQYGENTQIVRCKTVKGG